MQNRLCIIYDSSRPEDPRELFTELVTHVFPAFEALEALFGTVNTQTGHWRIDNALVPFQKSGWSCGLHVLRNAETVLFEKGLPRVISLKEENAKKLEVISNLMCTTPNGRNIMNSVQTLDDLEKLLVEKKQP